MFASKVEFGILSSRFSNFFSLISCISIFFQSFFIRNFTLSFTLVFFQNYSTLIYMFSFLSVSGQVAVAVGFLTRDPSLIWNTDTCVTHLHIAKQKDDVVFEKNEKTVCIPQRNIDATSCTKMLPSVSDK